MATRCKAVENFEGYGCVLREGHGGGHVFANDPVPAPPTRTEEPAKLKAEIHADAQMLRDALAGPTAELRRLRAQMATARKMVEQIEAEQTMVVHLINEPGTDPIAWADGVLRSAKKLRAFLAETGGER